jgi:hypothetical protein
MNVPRPAFFVYFVYFVVFIACVVLSEPRVPEAIARRPQRSLRSSGKAIAMHYDPRMLGWSLSHSQIARLPKLLLEPEAALSLIRQVVTRCWITTPKEQQSVAEIASQVNRLVSDALKQLEEDLVEMRGDASR